MELVTETPGLCRCCLSEGCNKILTAVYPWMSVTEVYADMLFECFSISLSHHPEGPDSSNNLICEICITRLRDATYFKKQDQDSERTFVNMMRAKEDIANKVLSYEMDPLIKFEAVDVKEEDPEDLQEAAYEDLKLSDEDNADDGLCNVEVSPAAPLGPAAPCAGAHDDNAKSFVCAHCTRVYKRNYNLLNHIVRMHSADIPNLCRFCGDQFSEKYLLKDHIKTVHKRFPCKTCGKTFSRRIHQVEHFHVHGEKPFDCHICGKKFARKYNLKCHLRKKHSNSVEKRLHTNIDEKYLRSNSVDKRLRSNSVEKLTPNVKKRLSSRGVEKQFVCNICGEKFTQEDSLKEHLCIHKQKYCCNICCKSFSSESTLNTHISTVHSNENQTVGNIEYDDNFGQRTCCHVCGKRFAHKEYLELHMRIYKYGNESPFSCDSCGKKLSKSEHIRKHQLLQNKITKFKCDVCKDLKNEPE